MTTREKGLLLTGLLFISGTLMFVDGGEQENQQYQLSTTLGVQPTSPSTRGPKTLAFGLDKPFNIIALNTPRNIFTPLRDPNQPKPKIITPPPKPKVITRPPRLKIKKPKLPPRPAPVNRKRRGTSLAAQQAQQQMQKYIFLGYLTKEGEKQIFLSNGQAIYIVKQGETLKGDIQVKSIEPTAVVLSKHLKSIGETVEATLPLTKDGKKT